MKSIEILIAPDGSLSIEAVGFKGADCDQATRFLEQALGLAHERRRKPEYHQSRQSQHQQKLGS